MALYLVKSDGSLANRDGDIIFRRQAIVQEQIRTKTKRAYRRRSSEIKEQDKNYITSGCRWYSRLKVYKGKHFYFDPSTKEARSYDWYSMLHDFDGVLVVNTCNYSSTTAKDFSKLYTCLGHEGLKPRYRIYAPRGLNNLEYALAWHDAEICRIRTAMAAKGSWKRKNVERLRTIAQLSKQIVVIKRLIKIGDID